MNIYMLFIYVISCFDNNISKSRAVAVFWKPVHDANHIELTSTAAALS